MQFLLLFAVLALNFADSWQCRHADFLAIFGARTDFCWFWAMYACRFCRHSPRSRSLLLVLGDVGMQVLLLFIVPAITFGGSGQCRHADLVTIYVTCAHSGWSGFILSVSGALF